MALSHLCRYRQGNERGIQPEVVNLATNGVSSLAFAPGKALTLKEQGYQTKFDYQGGKVRKRIQDTLFEHNNTKLFILFVVY